MKKQAFLYRICAVILCTVMLFGILPASVFAAKENFTTCSHIGIRNCAAPVAGNKPDYNVSAYSPGQYEIKSVNWYKGSVAAMNSVSSTMSFEYDTTYIVEFEVWAKDAYTFTRDSNGYTTVTADVSSGTGNGEISATVMNVSGQSNSKYLTVRCTYPKTERNVTVINSLSITGVVEPYAGDRAKYPVVTLPSYVGYYTDAQHYYYDVAWYDGTNKMSNQEYFEEGKTYSCHLSLKAQAGYEFAADPNHFFAQPGYPFPTVTATINGKTATVMPDNNAGPGNEIIIIAAQFTCKPSRQITSVEISNVTEPKTGEKPGYSVSFGDSRYGQYSLSNFAYVNGVAWTDKNAYMTAATDTFRPSSAYTIEIILKAKAPYVFKYTQQGAAVVTATVNGKEAEVWAHDDGEDCIIVRYTFRKTASLELSKVEVSGIDTPKDGELADYTMTLGDSSYTAFPMQDDYITKNSIMWFDRTTNKYMKPDVDRFIGGHTYSVFIELMTTGDYTFKYYEDEGVYRASAKINGKTASVDECSETELSISYDFVCPTVEHKCSPLKVDEVKANCKEEGKKAYYYCGECGKNYEDQKCTREITDINSWGITAKLEHSGGKATCDNLAICQNCGERYGEFAEHKFGSSFDYKDASGHAHKCRECGMTDEIVPHSGGSAKCGELAKCAGCGEEYGEVMQHQWSSSFDYKSNKGHAHKCSLCGEHDSILAHSGGTADCLNKAKCADCGTEYGKTGDHIWGSEWTYKDKKGHAYVCTVEGCDAHDSTEKHVPGAEATESDGQYCTVCNYMIKPAKSHKHKMTKVAAVDETCTTAGKKAYYYCSECDIIAEDSKGEKEIEDTESLVIPATGHKESGWKKNADGHWKECTAKGCDDIIPDTQYSHEFDENGKCIVCKYVMGGSSDTEEDTEDISETEDLTEDEAGSGEDDTSKESDTLKDDESDTDGEKTGDETPSDGLSIWIVVIIAAVVAAALAAVTVIVVKKNKKA